MLSPKSTASQPAKPTAPQTVVTAYNPSDSTAPADDYFNSGDSSDEERTHNSVLSRHLRKRRRTNSALMSTFSNSPFTPSSFVLSPPQFDIPLDALMDSENDCLARRRKSSSVPEADLFARQRCYDYLHNAIDAVWAEFCDSTTYAEMQKYMPNSPTSDSEGVVADAKEFATPKHDKRSDSISMQPQSQSLMKQKNRLTNAKDLLAHFVYVDSIQASTEFWKTWDILKYQIIEHVEGDDEIDETDEIIDRLEAGRCC